MEQLGIYSLGKSLEACHCLHPGGVLTDLVRKMTSAIDTVSLLHVLECVDNQWKILVGSSPISRFVAQLCKLTLGWTMTTSIPTSCGLSQTQTCRPALAATNHHEISHIEFSRQGDRIFSIQFCFALLIVCMILVNNMVLLLQKSNQAQTRVDLNGKRVRL